MRLKDALEQAQLWWNHVGSKKVVRTIKSVTSPARAETERRGAAKNLYSLKSSFLSHLLWAAWRDDRRCESLCLLLLQVLAVAVAHGCLGASLAAGRLGQLMPLLSVSLVASAMG